MVDILRPFLVVALTVLVIAGLSRLIGRSKPAAVSAQSGTIRPELLSGWLTVVAGSAICVAALWFLIYAHGGGAAAAAALIGAAIGGFMAPSVTSIHAVHWNEFGIEGPSKMFGPTLGLARTAIAWPDIAKTGKTITGYWYVQTPDGRRVYWSFLYKGYGALVLALRHQRPSLDLRF